MPANELHTVSLPVFSLEGNYWGRERGIGASYQDRFDTKWNKIGLRGLTKARADKAEVVYSVRLEKAVILVKLENIKRLSKSECEIMMKGVLDL